MLLFIFLTFGFYCKKMEMDRIESIFLPSYPVSIDSNRLNRIKLGEIFQIRQNNYIFVCTHCSQELHQFTDFTSHIDQHLRSVFENQIKNEEFELSADDEKLSTSAIDFDVNIKDESNSTEMVYYQVDSDHSTNERQTIDESSETVPENKIRNKSIRDNSTYGFIPGKHYIQIGKQFHCLTCNRLIKKRIKQHLLLHVKTEFSCPECSKTFSQVKYVCQHLKHVHKKKYTYDKVRLLQKNNEVDMDYAALKSVRKRHRGYQKVGKKIMCLICNCEITGQIREHMLTHSKKIISCPLCEKLFTNVRYVRNHLNQVHKQKYTNGMIWNVQQMRLNNQFNGVARYTDTFGSDDDEADDQSEEEIDEENDVAIGGENDGENDGVLKVRLMESIIAKLIVRGDALINDSKYVCGVCGKDFNKNNDIRYHLRTIHYHLIEQSLATEIPRTCYLCAEQLETFDQLQSHLHMHTNGEFECYICHKKSKRLHHLQRHLKCTHLWQFPSKKKKPAIHSPNFECYLCKKIFRYNSSLKFHFEYHTSEPLLCMICGQSYRGKNFHNHMLRHNNLDENKFQCNICHRKFMVEQSLSLHYRRLHTDSCPEVCNVCSKQFKLKKDLNRHIRKFHTI